MTQMNTLVSCCRDSSFRGSQVATKEMQYLTGYRNANVKSIGPFLLQPGGMFLLKYMSKVSDVGL